MRLPFSVEVMAKIVTVLSSNTRLLVEKSARKKCPFTLHNITLHYITLHYLFVNGKLQEVVCHRDVLKENKKSLLNQCKYGRLY